MNHKKLIIYEYDLLFEILYEIKENLNFELIKASKSNLNDIQSNITSDFLTVSCQKNDKLENQIILLDLPIQFQKLLEMINIKFLKIKFNLQSDVNIGDYLLNLNSRLITKDNISLNLTERETNLIVYLNKSNSAVNIDELQMKVWDYGTKLETHTVETHIYRLRKKFKEKFNDSTFISSLKGGYKIS